MSRPILSTMRCSTSLTISVKRRKLCARWNLRWGKTGADLEKLMQDYDRLSEEFRQAGGFTYEADIRAILNGFKFDESMWQMKIEELSGGQNTRLALAKMLLENQISWYWTSRPTTWILRPSPGWKTIWSIIVVPFSLSATTGIS